MHAVIFSPLYFFVFCYLRIFWSRCKHCCTVVKCPRSQACFSSFFLVFWRNSLLFSILAAPICIPINTEPEFPFLHILTSTYYLLSIYNSHSIGVRRYLIVILFCLYLMIRLAILNIFSCAYWPYVSFWKNFYSGLLSIFFIQVFLSFWYWVALLDILFANILSLSNSNIISHFHFVDGFLCYAKAFKS